MRVYLAARFDRKPEMRLIAERLQGLGHEVTSRWIWGDAPVTDKEREWWALTDVEDLSHADALVAFSDPQGQANIGGGRHVEFGMAMMLGKRIFVVGPKGEHVFHYWPGIEFYENVDQFVIMMTMIC